MLGKQTARSGLNRAGLTQLGLTAAACAALSMCWRAVLTTRADVLARTQWLVAGYEVHFSIADQI